MQKTKNELTLVLFCTLIGAFSGIVFWLFLLLVSRGTWLLWDSVPAAISASIWYPILVCTIGGVIIGLFRKKFGDYPEDMMRVFGRLKKEGTYPYKNMLVLIIAALLPLILGASIGPEAGMVGIITALCCWAGDNLRFAGAQSSYYSRIGAEVSLSVMFRSPLFGILDVEEEMEEGDNIETSITKSMKIIIYSLAIGGGFAAFTLLNKFVFEVSEAFPSFDVIHLSEGDIPMFPVYLFFGILLGILFEGSEKGLEKLSEKIPPVISEGIAGLILGVTIAFLPMVKFSGEEQMAELIIDFASYAPLFLIAVSVIKVLLTNLCIQFGLKGGHFFPLIFAAVCLGYGIALMFFPGEANHAIFAAAVCASGTLGVSMKKPLAVSVLLLLCFPVRSLIWMIPASAIASLAGKWLEKRKEIVHD